jgi:hypothetical protein
VAPPSVERYVPFTPPATTAPAAAATVRIGRLFRYAPDGFHVRPPSVERKTPFAFA